MYDSTNDTKMHIITVQHAMEYLTDGLYSRAIRHDASKLEEPEKSMYDKYIPQLQKTKYGTPEYNKVKREMADGPLKHHFEMNRHHPEHFGNDFSKMNLIDIVEMFVDWVSASVRSDTSFEDGLQSNQDRYKYPDILQDIFINTYREYFNGIEKKL